MSPAVGGCCAALGATACGANQLLLRCTDTGAADLSWQAAEECGGQMLACDSTGPGGPRCVCPTAGSNLVADPLNGSLADAGVRPTGIADPPRCRFSRLSDALAAAAALPSPYKTVTAQWPLYPKWTANLPYGIGARVIPPVPNGSVYECIQAGSSGQTEPDWESQNDISDYKALWKNAMLPEGDGTAFSSEQFPLTVPSQTTLRGSCQPGADGGCEVRTYVVLTALSSNSTSAMVNLSPGAGLSTLGLLNSTGGPGNAAVGCSSGTVSLEALLLIGQSGAARVGQGLRLEGTCQMTASGIAVGAFDIGAQVRSPSAALTLRTAYLGPIQANGNRTGIEILGGTLSAEGVYVLGSTGSGASVNTGSVSFEGGSISGNTGSGLEIVDGNCRLSGTTISSNGAGTGSGVSQPGVLLKGGSLTAGTAPSGERVSVAENFSDGIRVEGLATAMLKEVDLQSNNGFGLAVRKTKTSLAGCPDCVEVRSSTIINNAAGGISLGPSGGGGNVDALLEDNEIKGNKGPGVFVTRRLTPSVSLTRTWMKDNRILNNGPADGGSPGGLVFAGFSKVVEFSGNSLGGNIGPEIAYLPPAYGSEVLNLKGDCQKPNRLYCYHSASPGPEEVAVHNATGNALMDVTKFSWSYELPHLSGRDYSGDAGSYLGLETHCPGILLTCPP